MNTRFLVLIAALALTPHPASAQAAAPAPTRPSSLPATPPAVRNVSPAEFESLRKSTNAVVLDVRTPAECAEGHLAGSKLVDYRSAAFSDEVAKLDKSKLYLVHCAGGVRSAKACVKMMELGFTNLVNLEGGLSAWKDAGKPVEK